MVLHDLLSFYLILPLHLVPYLLLVTANIRHLQQHQKAQHQKQQRKPRKHQQKLKQQRQRN